MNQSVRNIIDLGIGNVYTGKQINQFVEQNDVIVLSEGVESFKFADLKEYLVKDCKECYVHFHLGSGYKSADSKKKIYTVEIYT